VLHSSRYRCCFFCCTHNLSFPGVILPLSLCLLSVMQIFCSANRVIFVLPQSQGAGWWDIDFASYALAMAMGEDSKARTLRAVPSGVLECRTLVQRLVAECREFYGKPSDGKVAANTSSGTTCNNSTGRNSTTGCNNVSSGLVPAQRTFFMGFSQGAMLALDCALHVNEAPLGGVVLVWKTFFVVAFIHYIDYHHISISSPNGSQRRDVV